MEKITPKDFKTARQTQALVLSVEFAKVCFLNSVKPLLKNAVSFYRDVKMDRNEEYVHWYVQLDDDEGFKLIKPITSSWYITSRDLCAMIRKDFGLTPEQKTVRFFLEPSRNNETLFKLLKM